MRGESQLAVNMEVVVVSLSQKFINFNVPHESTVRDLIRLFSPGEGIDCLDLYVKNNGRISCDDERLQTGAVYRLEPRLCGGKGGFGSMLRALGAQIEKTTNRGACRDLSGRRLRDVNHEKELAEWLKKQPDRDAEKERRRLERLERIRKKLAEPEHHADLSEFEQQCHELSERLNESMRKALQEDEKPDRKRPAENDIATTSKKKFLWLGLEEFKDLISSDEDSDESEAEASSSSSSAAGPSCSSQPAEVPTTATREQEKVSSKSSSSSSSTTSSSPCSPPPSSPSPCQEKPEEKEEHGKEVLETEENKSVSDPQEAKKDATVEIKDTKPVQPPQDSEAPLDLLTVSGVEELEALGLERLKAELMKRGMKCGGMLQERAARLYSVRGLTSDQIDPSLLPKPSKRKTK